VEEKPAVMEHLKKISTENDWHASQIQSALIALKALDFEGNSSND